MSTDHLPTLVGNPEGATAASERLRREIAAVSADFNSDPPHRRPVWGVALAIGAFVGIAAAMVVAATTANAIAAVAVVGVAVIAALGAAMAID